MKAQILSLIPIFASSVVAQPRARVFDNTDPITQQSRVTAFVVTDEGVSVECWAINNLLPSSTQQYNQQRGLKGPRVIQMASDDLMGVDLLTWPEPVPIWPPPRDYGSVYGQEIGLADSSNLFTVTDGLIMIGNIPITLYDDDDDEDGTYIFSAENGDNWFYFEDNTSGSSIQQCANAKRAEPPLTISTRSATDTTLVRFKYNDTPRHTVLHKGRCNFAGLADDSGSSRNRRHLIAQEL